MADYYRPEDIRRMSNSDLRKIYSRQRSIANKRIQRLRTAGLGNKDRNLFPKLSEMSPAQTEVALADVSKFLRSARTTVTGERRFINAEVRVLQDRGYDFIDQSNIYEFIQFMDAEREEAGSKMFSSGDAVDVFNEGQRLNVPPEVLHKHFDYFVENMDKMENIQPIRSGREMSFSDVKRKINRL